MMFDIYIKEIYELISFNMKNLETFLQQLDELNLDINQYFISSSGSLAARGIRDCNDLDVIVTQSLFSNLKKRFPATFKENNYSQIVSYKNIDFIYITKGDRKYSTKDQIDSSDIIFGKRFQNLDVTKYFKQLSAREKDLTDLELINQYKKNLNISEE